MPLVYRLLQFLLQGAVLEKILPTSFESSSRSSDSSRTRTFSEDYRKVFRGVPRQIKAESPSAEKPSDSEPERVI